MAKSSNKPMKRITNLIRKIRSIVIRIILSGRPTIETPDLSIVFAPHPDDEVFGCCGLIQRLIESGKQVEILIMSGGEKSHQGCCDIDPTLLSSHRRQLTLNAASLYGIDAKNIHFFDFPDGGINRSHPKIDQLTTFFQKIIIGQQNVSIFYPHQKGEGWPDHVNTAKIAQTLGDTYCPLAHQYEYCVWFWYYNCWTINRTHAYLVTMDKSAYRKKQSAIVAYTKPCAPCGHPWSGILPQPFLWAFKWRRELFFKVK